MQTLLKIPHIDLVLKEILKLNMTRKTNIVVHYTSHRLYFLYHT